MFLKQEPRETALNDVCYLKTEHGVNRCTRNRSQHNSFNRFFENDLKIWASKT